jgi:hypothetical protein
MATDDPAHPLDAPDVIPGDPLLPPTHTDPLVEPPVGSMTEPVAPVVTTSDAAAVGATGTGDGSTVSTERPDEHDEGGSKLKTGALLAGAAALANKVRHEAPRKVQQLREKRAEGRCVIVTEVDGRMLAIGPYKDEESAEPQAFKVGGTPRIVQLVTDAAFFAPAAERPGS